MILFVVCSVERNINFANFDSAKSSKNDAACYITCFQDHSLIFIDKFYLLPLLFKKLLSGFGLKEFRYTL